MTGKLIKHEFRATSRTFLPLLGGVCILWGLAWGVTKLGGILVLPGGTSVGGGPVFGLISGIIVMLTFVGLVALMLGSVFVTFQRFYKNILGDEGYLMCTLPVTSAQHILTKLLVGVAWTVLSLVVAITVGDTLYNAIPGSAISSPDGPTVIVDGNVVVHSAEEFESVMGMAIWQAVALMALLFLAGVVNTYLLGYLSMAIGSRWPQQRLGASVGVFVVIHMIRQTVYLIGMFVATALIYGRHRTELFAMAEAGTFDYGLLFLLITTIPSAVFLAESAVYFFTANHLLTKKLNLP